jgi:predicted HAD superfamily Cof-like phosphohydrolase
MNFESKIADFNNMYGLPVSSAPFMLTTTHLLQFKKMLMEEMKELDEIIEMVDDGQPAIDVLTALADFTGDVQVYCASEMKKWGIPLEATLEIIMKSNMSKLGEDGTAIMKDGKVQKGPNYWKPEPMLKSMLQSLQSNSKAG